MLGLADRLIVVAGAGGGGIGTDVCARIAAEGGHVLALDNSEQGCATAREALGGDEQRHSIVQIDLTDEARVREVLATAQAKHGPARGLVNIVGGIPRRALIAPLLDEAATDNFERLMRHNLLPSLTAARGVARLAIEHRAGASIVNLGSMSGNVSMAYAAGYGAAKAALIHLTRTMAVEWGRHGIRVNAVSPGTIRVAKIGRDRLVPDDPETDARAVRTIPLGRRGVPADVANPILFLLSDLAGYISGQIIGVDGGGTALPPGIEVTETPLFASDPATRQRIG